MDIINNFLFGSKKVQNPTYVKLKNDTKPVANATKSYDPVSKYLAPFPFGPASPHQYHNPRNSGLHDTGYYTDLSKPLIANRPVYTDYNSYTYPDPRINYPEGKFDCLQPNWSKECL
jgi:hypothetical protein